MTLLGLLWVAHLPSSLGYFPTLSAAARLEEPPQVEQSRLEVQPSSATTALDSGLDSASLTPLQTLASQAMQDLAIAVDWQRWTNTAAVTVVTTTALESTASADPALQPKTLTSATCPAAHPPKLEAKAFRLASSALAPMARAEEARRKPAKPAKMI